MGGGQSSLEYLIIVGIALGILVPAVFFFASYTSSRGAAGTAGQIAEIGTSMVTAASEAYALGAGARRQVDVTLPEGVARIWVQGSELAFSYESPNGVSDAVFFAAVPLNSSYPDGNVTVPHAGATRFRFVSLGASVSVTEVVS